MSTVDDPTVARILAELGDIPGPPTDVSPNETASVALLDDAFWNARPVLRHIRQAAHSRNRSAHALLGIVLARVAAATPHSWQLPPIVGSPASLNLIVSPIAPSGVGKSNAAGIGRDLMPFDMILNVIDEVQLSSGEGLAEVFMGEVTEEDAEGKKKKVRAQVNFNAFVYVDEGEALTQLAERKGATLSTTLRRAWSGEPLGQHNGTAERTRLVPAHNYRLGIVVAFQPSTAGKLLADAAGGTPQRFLFVDATDATVPDEAPPWPDALRVERPNVTAINKHTVTSAGHRRVHLGVHPDIALEIRRADLASVRGEAVTDELDSHARLQRLKVAGLLAILDGRLDIDLEDWRLATAVWDASCTVRTRIVTHLAYEARLEEAQRTRRAADRETVVEAARRGATSKVDRFAARIARWAHDNEQPTNGWAKRDLRARLASNEKVLFPEVLSAALAFGYLDETDDGRFLRGASRPA